MPLDIIILLPTRAGYLVHTPLSFATQASAGRDQAEAGERGRCTGGPRGEHEAGLHEG